MSGHSHWAGIKHQKAIADAKRGKEFSKFAALIAAAARTEPNPEFNPRLRTAIQKAKEAGVPKENIERAVARAKEVGANLEEIIFEGYGPGGVAILMQAITDNRNRVVQEIKKILGDHGGKWAEPGSVRWAFTDQGGTCKANFEKKISPKDKESLRLLLRKLEEHEAIQKLCVDADLSPS